MQDARKGHGRVAPTRREPPPTGSQKEIEMKAKIFSGVIPALMTP